MSDLDFSFVDTARALEVEAVEGGRQLNEFALAPIALALDEEEDRDDEETTVLGRSADCIEQTEERLRAVRQFVPHAERAYAQRGLIYPFQPSESGDALEILPGQKQTALRSAELGAMNGKGQNVAKQFEETAFRALYELIGGWGACVGTPRRGRQGPKRAIDKFRASLDTWEQGMHWPTDFKPSGDRGADGFLILGRGWGGPIVFYQAKNTNFSLKGRPEEFGRIPGVLHDWFGKRWNQYRSVIPVLAANTVLTLEDKGRIFEARGAAGEHIIDAVDILCAEFARRNRRCRLTRCTVY